VLGGVVGAAALIVIETDSVMSDELAIIVDDADVLLEFYRYMDRSSEPCFLTRITHEVTSRWRRQRRPCRKMSAGQRAMATALVLQAYGRRHSDGTIQTPEELGGVGCLRCSQAVFDTVSISSTNRPGSSP
jgi:hypothetical protein